MTNFEIGDRVRLKGSDAPAMTVREKAVVVPSEWPPFQVFKTDAFDMWMKSVDYELAPPEKPKYRLKSTYDSTSTIAVTTGNNWTLCAHAPLTKEQQQAALRAGMAAIGYEEQQ